MILLTPRCAPDVLPDLCQDFLYLTVGDNYLRRLLLPVDRLPVTFQLAVFQRQ